MSVYVKIMPIFRIKISVTIHYFRMVTELDYGKLIVLFHAC